MNENLKIDVKEIVAQKAPNKKFPTFFINYLKKIIHQDEINHFMEKWGHKKNLEFMTAGINEELKTTASFEGLEKLPQKNGRYIFASNHPLGGLDGMVLGLELGKHYDGKVRFFSNDILMFLKPLNEMMIPINKTGGQTREILRQVEDFYKSDQHLITFPAGTCSRKNKGKIEDIKWNKNFIVKSVEYERDVIPIYFEGRNSNFFYNLSNIRKKFGLPNIEMLYLANEMYKQRGKHFNVKIGDRIPYSTFDKSKKPIEWAEWVRQLVYRMA